MTDEKEEGIFINIDSGEKIPDGLNFWPGEPNGGTTENCLKSWYIGDMMLMADVSCEDPNFAFCALGNMPQPKIRG